MLLSAWAICNQTKLKVETLNTPRNGKPPPAVIPESQTSKESVAPAVTLDDTRNLGGDPNLEESEEEVETTQESSGNEKFVKSDTNSATGKDLGAYRKPAESVENLGSSLNPTGILDPQNTRGILVKSWIL